MGNKIERTIPGHGVRDDARTVVDPPLPVADTQPISMTIEDRLRRAAEQALEAVGQAQGTIQKALDARNGSTSAPSTRRLIEVRDQLRASRMALSAALNSTLP